jgi:hypothetical protein
MGRAGGMIRRAGDAYSHAHPNQRLLIHGAVVETILQAHHKRKKNLIRGNQLAVDR